jgi:hypothetical protein
MIRNVDELTRRSTKLAFDSGGGWKLGKKGCHATIVAVNVELLVSSKAILTLKEYDQHI